MTDLIACTIGGGPRYGQVRALIEKGSWDKVYLIGDKESKDFSPSDATLISIDTDRTIIELVQDIRKALSGKIVCTEYALNIVYGPGKVHTAIISAILKLGCGIRMVAFTKEGIKEI